MTNDVGVLSSRRMNYKELLADLFTFVRESAPSAFVSFSRCSASYVASVSASRQAATVRMLSLLKSLNRQSVTRAGKPRMKEAVATVGGRGAGEGGGGATWVRMFSCSGRLNVERV